MSAEISYEGLVPQQPPPGTWGRTLEGLRTSLGVYFKYVHAQVRHATEGGMLGELFDPKELVFIGLGLEERIGVRGLMDVHLRTWQSAAVSLVPDYRSVREGERTTFFGFQVGGGTGVSATEIRYYPAYEVEESDGAFAGDYSALLEIRHGDSSTEQHENVVINGISLVDDSIVFLGQRQNGGGWENIRISQSFDGGVEIESIDQMEESFGLEYSLSEPIRRLIHMRSKRVASKDHDLAVLVGLLKPIFNQTLVKQSPPPEWHI